jgi:NADPH-dependent 2,4-dienoyl-CoA reductase/sulfur reductase-like enzyme
MKILAPTDHVVIVGGGLSGWRMVTGLRSHGFTGDITLICEEDHAPYDRPPLSKQVLEGKWPITQTTFATPELISQANVDVILGDGATSLDVATKTVTLRSGRAVRATHVVIATGARARRLPDDDLVQYVRTFDDTVKLVTRIETMPTGSPIAVIGGGFIGAEVATALTKRGMSVTVFEALDAPLVQVLGPTVAQWLIELPYRAGVELRTLQSLTQVVQHGEAVRLTFADGQAFDASLVIAGIGAIPATQWLEGSGLVIDGGVVVDAHGEATDNIAAIGDVARGHFDTALGPEVGRIEHWQIASDHAARLARWWALGEETLEPLVPYFWSDQYGKKIQVLGRPRPSDAVTLVKGSIEEASWLALYHRDDVVVAAVALSQPRALMLAKSLIASRHTLAAAIAISPWSA